MYKNSPSDVIEIDFIGIFRTLYRHRFFIFSFSIFVFLIFAITAFLLPKTYIAETKLLPTKKWNQNNQLNNMMSLANTFGGNFGTQSDFSVLFSDVIKSYPFYKQLANTNFSYGVNQEPLPLLKILTIDMDNQESTDHIINELAFQKYKSLISISISDDNGIAKISVSSNDKNFSASFANGIALQLEQYFLKNIRTNAKENLKFIKEIRKEAKNELIKASKDLMKFREKNLSMKSPKIQLRFNELLRTQKIKEEKFLQLTKQYNLARIDVIKEKPVIDIFEPARVPVYKSKPRRKLIFIFGSIVGIISSIVIVLLFNTTKYLKNQLPLNKFK